MRLRSKVVEIEAEEYKGLVNGRAPRKIVDFVGTGVMVEGEHEDSSRLFLSGSQPPHYLALLLDGTLRVWNDLEKQWINCPVGHYVLKGLKGEFYPCEPEALFMKYDIIDG